MSFTHFLVVGANRGIGYEMVHQLLQTSSHKVVATYRDPSKLESLNSLLSDEAHKERLFLIKLDMNDGPGCKMAAEEARSRIGNLDVVIVNAGVNMKGSSPLLSQDLDQIAEIFGNNVLGPLRICQAFVPLLRSQRNPAKLVFISSEAGSITVQRSLRSPAYGISKAALNMAGRKLAAELEPSNIAVALIHPGWVKTDMGGANAQITPKESVSGILQVISRLDMGSSGEFWEYNGNRHPW